MGRSVGADVVTKKSQAAKKLIKAYSRDFNGTLKDVDAIIQIRARLGKLSRNSYYKYKRELIEELT